jgi:hypothetical protein
LKPLKLKKRSFGYGREELEGRIGEKRGAPTCSGVVTGWNWEPLEEKEVGSGVFLEEELVSLSKTGSVMKGEDPKKRSRALKE